MERARQRRNSRFLAGPRLHWFLEDNVIDTLNVAGPRKSKEPEIAEFVYQILDQVFFRERNR